MAEGFSPAKKPRLDENKDHEHIIEAGSAGPPSTSSNRIATKLLEIEGVMCRELEDIAFGPPVTHIYNPLDYAAIPHRDYVSRYGNTPKKILFLGMNPGPFGMAQNGVAFGDSEMVRVWLEVSGTVTKPTVEHPKRVIHGLACTRAEVSGSRFWGLFRELCGLPQVFFKNCYVHNYCPFCFMKTSGQNITPPSLKAAEKSRLQEVCDGALIEVIKLLQVEWVVGVGKFGADRAKAAMKANCPALKGEASTKRSSCCGKKTDKKGVERFLLHDQGRGSGQQTVYVSSIMHPSPISPPANRGWAEQVTSQLAELGLLDIIRKETVTEEED